MRNRSLRPMVVTVGFLMFAATLPPAWGERGFYLGGGAGATRYDSDVAQQVLDAYAPTMLTTTASFDKTRDRGYQLFVGYRFTDYLAVELAYAHLGESELSYTVIALGNRAETRATYEIDGFAMSLVGRYPLTSQLFVFGKAGMMRSRLDYREATVASVGSSSFQHTNKENNSAFGLGLEYNFASHWSARVEWNRFLDIGNDFRFRNEDNGKFDTIDWYGLSLLYRF